MPIEVCVRHIEVSDALKDFAHERFTHAVRHVQKVSKGRVVLERSGRASTASEHRVHAEVHSELGHHHAQSVGPDLRQCIERATEKLQAQIGRDHERRGSRH